MRWDVGTYVVELPTPLKNDDEQQREKKSVNAIELNNTNKWMPKFAFDCNIGIDCIGI